MRNASKVVLLVAASVAFTAGIAGSILLFPDTVEIAQARGSKGASETSDGNLKWQTSLSEASDLAKKEHKYVLADIYTDWCGWCKKLDKDVFAKPEVQAFLNKDFICVKVNAEDPKEGSKVASTYRVNGFPCALVFNPEGKLIGKVDGYEDAGAYIQDLKKMKGEKPADGESATAPNTDGNGNASQE